MNKPTKMDKTIFMGLTIGVVAVVAMITATTVATITPVHAQKAACPDHGYCTCNPASGVMTDHAMEPPYNKINNGCTEDA